MFISESTAGVHVSNIAASSASPAARRRRPSRCDSAWPTEPRPRSVPGSDQLGIGLGSIPDGSATRSRHSSSNFAAYAELDVAWVRTLFVLGTLVTAGILGLVYIALAFILPVAATREAYDI